MGDRRTELLYKLRASEITPPEALELDSILDKDRKAAEEGGDQMSAAVLSLGKIVLTPYILKAERAKVATAKAEAPRPMRSFWAWLMGDSLPSSSSLLHLVII